MKDRGFSSARREVSHRTIRQGKEIGWKRVIDVRLLVCLLLLVWSAAYATNQYVFSTNPPTAAASVFVDGTYVGSTDENGKVVISSTEPGMHLLRVESGGKSYTAEVPFDAELNSLPPFSLGGASGGNGEVDYRIDTNVAAAEVVVDGVSRGETDNAGRALLRLSTGQAHTVEVRKTGFAMQSQSVVPTAGGELKLALQPLPETTEPRIDVLLVSLVVLLAGSVALLLVLVMRHRARPIAQGVAMRPSSPEQSVGHFDRYRLLSPLGSGGVAMIYRAEDLIEKSAVALKVLDTRWLADPEMVRKFLAEGEALHAVMQHDSNAAVVKCYRYGREHDSIVGRPFIALELLVGETLQNRLDREHVLDPLTATATAYQIASALIAVHGAGIVHRDLTPDNVFLRKGDLIVGGARFSVPLVVLIDFGIARQELLSHLTLDGSIAGKPHYMSPEQCRGMTVDARSDLYSLGVMLYLMAAGRLPFTGRDPFEVMREHMADPPPRLAGKVDQRYADLCERLLQKSAEDRPQSAAAVTHELEQILLSIGASASMNVVSFPTRRVSL
jgi:hypothetical protein